MNALPSGRIGTFPAGYLGLHTLREVTCDMPSHKLPPQENGKHAFRLVGRSITILASESNQILLISGESRQTLCHVLQSKTYDTISDLLVFTFKPPASKANGLLAQFDFGASTKLVS